MAESFNEIIKKRGVLLTFAFFGVMPGSADT